MKDSLDNGVDDDTIDQAPIESNVVCMRPSAVERKLRRDPSYYATLMQEVCKASQEM